ncbi:phosphotransferase [Nitrospira defluvii]|nr:phosphotransferase [Nitrospira defluvii]
MIDPERLRKILSKTFQSSICGLKIKQIPGDASDRVYQRLCWEEIGSSRSVILMEMADLEAALSSAEAMEAVQTEIQELPFINIQKHLLASKVPVPEIYFFDEALSWILLEDLGDNRLAEWVETYHQDTSQLLDYYEQAIDALLRIQFDASPRPNPPTIAHQRQFDRSLFEWEFDHFIEYGIESQRGSPLPQTKRTAIRNHFSDIASHLAALPQVFTHRDYHSRNLMIHSDSTGQKISIIDFQDALMGPAQYDLASLLRDSYVDLPEEIIDNLLDYYYEQFETRSGKPIDRKPFRESFDLMSIQRNLKAAGRFIFIDKVKKKDHLLRYVKPTLAKVRINLEKYHRLKPLHELLAEYVEALR